MEIRGFRAPRSAGTGDIAVEGGPAEQYLAAKYNEQSELSVTIEADGSNVIQDFDLSSE